MAGVALLLFGIGWVGGIVPGLPTTVFWLGAVLCAGKACPAIERWVYARPYFGPIVRDLVENRTMPRANKTRAMIGMGAAVATSATLFALGDVWWAAAGVVASGMVGGYFICFGFGTTGQRASSAPAVASRLPDTELISQ